MPSPWSVTGEAGAHRRPEPVAARHGDDRRQGEEMEQVRNGVRSTSRGSRSGGGAEEAVHEEIVGDAPAQALGCWLINLWTSGRSM